MNTPPPQLLGEIAEVVGRSDFARANAIATKALREGFVHPALFNVQAMWHERNDRDPEAVELFRRAETLAPEDPAILNALGLCLARLKRFAEAVAALRKATVIRPGHAPGHYRLGHTLWQANRFPEAEQALKKALALEPQMAVALSCMAAVRAGLGDMPAAGSHARRALQLNPNDPLAVSVVAATEISEGKTDTAMGRLDTFLSVTGLPTQARVMALGLKAQALRSQGRAKESYEVYALRNGLLASRVIPGEGLARQLQTLNNFLDRASSSFWRTAAAAPIESGPSRHVFVVGFPRTGSEMFAQILGRHPAVALQSGHDLLAQAAGEYLADEAALQRFDHLDAAQLAGEREKYWTGIRANGLAIASKVLIDASPSNAMRLPLIAKLFADARVVVMQREPRDVIASCFAELPRVADVIGDALGIVPIASLFDQIARIVHAARNRMTLPMTAVRYENLIADPEGSLSATCEFIGLEWERRQFERRGTHESDFGYGSERAGMWRDWAAEISPTLPLLQNWLDEGGYR